MQNVALKFVRVRIGSISIKVAEMRSPKVMLNDIQVDLQLLNEFELQPGKENADANCKSDKILKRINY